MIIYKPAKILSISSATGWSHHSLEDQMDFDPVAVFALVELHSESGERQMILPMSAAQLSEFNKSGSIGIHNDHGDMETRLAHISEFEDQ